MTNLFGGESGVQCSVVDLSCLHFGRRVLDGWTGRSVDRWIYKPIWSRTEGLGMEIYLCSLHLWLSDLI